MPLRYKSFSRLLAGFITQDCLFQVAESHLWNAVIRGNSTPISQVLWKGRSLILKDSIFQGVKLLPVMKIGESLLLVLGAAGYESRFPWWWQGFKTASRNNKAFLRPMLRTGIPPPLLSLCLLREELPSYAARGMMEGFQTFCQPHEILRSKPFSARCGSIASPGSCSLYLLCIERAAPCQTAGTTSEDNEGSCLCPECTGHRGAIWLPRTLNGSVSPGMLMTHLQHAVMGSWLESSAL